MSSTPVASARDPRAPSGLFSDSSASAPRSSALFGVGADSEESRPRASLFGGADSEEPRPRAALLGAGVAFEDSRPHASLFGAGAASEEARPRVSLFGAGAVSEEARPRASLFGQAKVADTGRSDVTTREEAATREADDIDSANPGSASQLKAQFERRMSQEDLAAQKSWKPVISKVALPDGQGSTAVHSHGADGGAYRQKTSFSKAPPPRKSFADLP